MDNLIFKASVFVPSLTPLFVRARTTINSLKDEPWFPFESKQQNTPFFIAVGRYFENYAQLAETFNFPVNKQNDRLFDLITDSDRYFVSTSLTKPGFSGGGIFNTNGELLGINSMSPSVPLMMKQGFQPLMSHVRINYIREQVENKVGREMADRIFGCK